MFKSWLSFGLIALLLAPLVSHGQQWRTNMNEQPLMLAQNGTISKSEAIAIARRQVAGKVLAADLVRQGSQSVYKIKILTQDGRVKTVMVNANRG